MKEKPKGGRGRNEKVWGQRNKKEENGGDMTGVQRIGEQEEEIIRNNI